MRRYILLVVAGVIGALFVLVGLDMVTLSDPYDLWAWAGVAILALAGAIIAPPP